MRQVKYRIHRKSDKWPEKYHDSKEIKGAFILLWTGLTDIKGVYIHEGDVVEWFVENKSKGKTYKKVRRQVVRWDAKRCGITPMMDQRKPKTYEVLGTIFANPELRQYIPKVVKKNEVKN